MKFESEYGYEHDGLWAQLCWVAYTSPGRHSCVFVHICVCVCTCVYVCACVRVYVCARISFACSDPFPSFTFPLCFYHAAHSPAPSDPGPLKGVWMNAVAVMRGLNHDYVITGHPARSCTWDSYTSGFACNGLGYISTLDTIDGANWNALTDGNTAERRYWPAANSPTVTSHRLASLCASFDDIGGVSLWAGYIWRDVVGGCSPSSIHSFMINPRLWLCSSGAVTDKPYANVGGVCNQAGSFNLPSVGPMSRRGKPNAVSRRHARILLCTSLFLPALDALRLMSRG